MLIRNRFLLQTCFDVLCNLGYGRFTYIQCFKSLCNLFRCEFKVLFADLNLFARSMYKIKIITSVKEKEERLDLN